ncbi:hypothetical protein EAM_0519 [Erwinia amylovora ATCC 49946]|nr:hypothetical protein EAM_0519 [Erwinia amylovora ATCC 49946]
MLQTQKGVLQDDHDGIPPGSAVDWIVREIILSAAERYLPTLRTE